MALQTILPLAIAVLVLYFVVDRLLTYRKLSQFKGPFVASISELWLFKQTVQGRVYLATADALEKYGSPARIGPNLLMTDDPVIIRAMATPGSPFTRGHWFEGMKLDPRIDNILSEKDEKRHAELRSKLMGGYTGKDVPSLEAEIDDRVVDLINLIRREYNGKTLDFARLAQYFTLDALTQIAFGQPFGFLTENKDVYDYVKSSTEYFPIMELGSNIPLINSILTSRLMQALAAPKPEDRVGLGRVVGIAQKVVAERFGPDAKIRDDVMGSFVAHGLTQQEAESESLLLILAGADSTATVIRCTFLYILTNPPVYAKLLAEIDEAVANGAISFPVVKHAEAKKMPYLQACIKEGLRIWPPLNGIVDKISPPGGQTINGVFFPPGVRVAQNLRRLLRRKDFWGEDSDIFRPERWIEANADTKRNMEKTWDLSFGHGRSTCLGRNIAMTELSKLFVELLRTYEWGIVDPVHTIDSKCYAIFVQRNLNLRAWPRNDSTR